MHAYLNKHIEELKKFKRELYRKVVSRANGTKVREVTYRQPYLSLNIAFFFSRIFAVGIDETVRISVELFAEGGLDRSTDEFWAPQMRLARGHEQAC